MGCTATKVAPPDSDVIVAKKEAGAPRPATPLIEEDTTDSTSSTRLSSPLVGAAHKVAAAAGPSVDGWVGDYRGRGVGRGKRVFADGVYYEGEWKDGVRFGQGKQVWPDGRRYDGGWEQDNMDGNGRYLHANGNSYEGQFKAGLYHGKGRYRYGDGMSYEGEYKEGKYHGRGKFTWANGHVMLTKYDADRPVGQGVGWTADRTKAVELLDGTPGRTIRLDEAEAIAARIGLPVPERGMPLCFFGA